MVQVFGCRKKMSAIAILDYAGAEALFKQMEQHAEEGRKEWELNNKEVSSQFPCQHQILQQT